MPFWGSGSSIDSEYAIQRAVTECLQSYQLFDKDDLKANRARIKDFKASSSYSDALKFKLSVPQKTINYTENKAKVSCVSDELKILVERLRKRGYKAYAVNLMEMNRFSCNQVVIPGLDIFNLILEGEPILPGKRTKVVIKGELSKVL